MRHKVQMEGMTLLVRSLKVQARIVSPGRCVEVGLLLQRINYTSLRERLKKHSIQMFSLVKSWLWGLIWAKLECRLVVNALLIQTKRWELIVLNTFFNLFTANKNTTYCFHHEVWCFVYNSSYVLSELFLFVSIIINLARYIHMNIISV